MKQVKNKSKKLKFLIVNLVTSLRLAGILALLPVFINFGALGAAGLCVGVFATDAIDGFLARKWKVSTFFGSGLDALADKLFGILSLSTLLLVTKMAILPILMELSIWGVNILKYNDNQNIHSFKSGKVKTIVLAVCIVLAFALAGVKDLGYLKSIPDLLINLPIFLTLMGFEAKTLYDYVRDYKEQKNEKIERENNETHEEKIERIEKERQDLMLKKEYLKTIKNPWTNHEFYEKEKDNPDYKTDLKLIREIKNERRRA